MTVCIAALYDNGGGCILVSDQMTTAHFPIGYQFESEEVEKIVEVVDSFHALIAGDVLFAHEVIVEAKRAIAQNPNQAVAQLAEIVRASYQNIRRRNLIHTVLEPRGLNLNVYIERQQRFQPAIVQMIDQQFVNFSPGVDFIVAGRDSEGCHIYTVRNPGQCICNDPVGFATIGTGGPHAFYSLIEAGYRKSMPRDQVRDLVLKAKTRSEVAPGVGAETTQLDIQPEMPKDIPDASE